MELWPIPVYRFEGFLLVLIRVSIILFMFPFFNARLIPPVLKAGLALIVTMTLMPVLNDPGVKFPTHPLGLGKLIVAELMIGLILGLMTQVIFEGVQMMGHVVGFQTGFAISNIIDPQNGIQVSILSNMAYLVAMMTFLLLNGHHVILNAMGESFRLLPFGSVELDRELFDRITSVSGEMFVLAIRMGAPAIAALLFTKVVLGLITKLIPQMNIMIVAFPLQVFIGLVFFGICLSTLMVIMERYLGGLPGVLMRTMTLLKV